MHEMLSEELSDITRHTSLFLPINAAEAQRLTPAFDYTITSYDLGKIIRGIVKPYDQELAWYYKKISTLRQQEGKKELAERRTIAAIQFTLHERVVDILAEGLELCFHYVERAPEGQHHRGDKVPDLLCQYPKLPLHVYDIVKKTVYDQIGRFPTTIIEVKTGKPSGAKKQLITYHRRKLGNDHPCAKIRYSASNHHTVPYPRMS